MNAKIQKIPYGRIAEIAKLTGLTKVMLGNTISISKPNYRASRKNCIKIEEACKLYGLKSVTKELLIFGTKQEIKNAFCENLIHKQTQTKCKHIFIYSFGSYWGSPGPIRTCSVCGFEQEGVLSEQDVPSEFIKTLCKNLNVKWDNLK